MPLYVYECPVCGKQRSDMRTVEERHDGPVCPGAGTQMKLVINAVPGIVKNPAVPRSSK